MKKKEPEKTMSCERRPGVLPSHHGWRRYHLDLVEFQRELAFYQLECGVSFGGGRPHANSARVLRRSRQQYCGESRDRFLARNREGRGTLYFEPLHTQYLPLCNEVVEIIQTQVAETNGDLVKFGEGHTIVTLHLKKT